MKTTSGRDTSAVSSKTPRRLFGTATRTSLTWRSYLARRYMYQKNGI